MENVDFLKWENLLKGCNVHLMPHISHVPPRKIQLS